MASNAQPSHSNGVVLDHARDNMLDVRVTFRGKRFHVKDVGIGHPPHTITEQGGRVSTDAEIALAKALAAEVYR